MTNYHWGLLRTLDCKLLSTAILGMAILEIMAKMMTRMAMTMIMMIKGGLLSISGRATYQMTALGRPIHLLWFRLTKDFSFNINIIVIIIIIIQPSSSTLWYEHWAWSSISFMMTGPQEVEAVFAFHCFSIRFRTPCLSILYLFTFAVLCFWVLNLCVLYFFLLLQFYTVEYEKLLAHFSFQSRRCFILLHFTHTSISLYWQ